MLAELTSKSSNVCMRFLHLGLQIIAGYWAVVIDGYGCQQAFVQNVTYFAYAMIGFNILLFAYLNSRTIANSVAYVPLIVNLGLTAGMLYFTIEGYNKYNNCAPTKALYEFFFIEILIALVLFVLIMIARAAWADTYANWPGNLAWPILFLKVGFPGIYHSPALAIGIIFAIISITSLIVNAMRWKVAQTTRSNKVPTAQWSLSMILMFACQVLAIVMLVTTGKDGDYHWQYTRKIFVIFAAVNIIDFFFWFYGYRKFTVLPISH